MTSYSDPLHIWKRSDRYVQHQWDLKESRKLLKSLFPQYKSHLNTMSAQLIAEIAPFAYLYKHGGYWADIDWNQAGQTLFCVYLAGRILLLYQ